MFGLKIPKLLHMLLIACMLGCWLTCISEADASHHDDVGQEACTGCCKSHHQGTLASSQLRTNFSMPLLQRWLPTDYILEGQTVIRLTDRPPKFSL